MSFPLHHLLQPPYSSILQQMACLLEMACVFTATLAQIKGHYSDYTHVYTHV